MAALLVTDAVVFDDAVVLLVAAHGIERGLVHTHAPGIDDLGLAGFLAADGHAQSFTARIHGLDDQVVVARILVDIGNAPHPGALTRPVDDLDDELLRQSAAKLCESLDRLLRCIGIVARERRLSLVQDLLRGVTRVVVGSDGQDGLETAARAGLAGPCRVRQRQNS